MKRWLVCALCLVLLCGIFPVTTSTAEENPSVKAQTLTVGQLRAKYPHGTYWNHSSGGAEDYTTTPCTHHVGNCAYSGSCGCNTYRSKSIQCMGFAYQLASLAYGCEPSGEWTANYNKSALDTLKAGDIVRYRWNGHSIFVLAVEGDTVRYADCNWDGRCGIRWDATVTKDTLKASFTYVKASPFALPNEPALAVNYHSGGGTIENEVVSTTYRVLSTNGINMRADAGTDQTKITALPENTTFTVLVGDTKEANGYTWGKTTYNGKTGWVVISDFVEKVGDNREGAWCVSEGLVCHSDGTPLTQSYLYGVATDLPVDPAQWGLTKEGYRFAGWCTAEDGIGVLWTAGMKPEELCPDQAETLTLYAVWNPIVPGDVNGDGRLNNRDLGLLQRYLNDWAVTIFDEADINADGVINNQDLGRLQQKLNEE